MRSAIIKNGPSPGTGLVPTSPTRSLLRLIAGIQATLCVRKRPAYNFSSLDPGAARLPIRIVSFGRGLRSPSLIGHDERIDRIASVGSAMYGLISID
jgi:hypothetical protein